MGSSLHLNFMLRYLVSILICLNKLVAPSFSPPLQPKIPLQIGQKSLGNATFSVLCDASDTSALLQFKASFVIDKLASSNPLPYPKFHSWSPQGDCCLWDGVLCNKNDGHVIGLDLTSSWLSGSINSNSSLFRLKHLRMLSLADNNFNYSRIPAEIAHLCSTLTHLDLSGSFFSGEIPSEISRLSKLLALDLSKNTDSFQRSLLQLNSSTFENLVQNATSLALLKLSWVDVSSKVPNTLANLTSLSLLYLKECNLQGEFPNRILLLPKLEWIGVRFNQDLTGHLPRFSNHSQLKSLLLTQTSLSGEIPYSIQNLRSLTELDLSYANFSGPIPPLASLTKLEYLGLASCQLGGHTHFPIWIQNLTHLTYLDLSNNNLQSPIPKSMFSQLGSLTYLSLYANNLSGALELDQFPLKASLSAILLGYNPYLSAVDCNNCSDKFPNLTKLDLRDCSINKFPSWLRHQHKLTWFSLRNNMVHGLIPTWLSNASKDTLLLLDLANNSLTGFGQRAPALPWVNLQMLDISFNLLQGSLPVPPPSISYYLATSNKMTGEIPSIMCNSSSSLSFLDLAFNNLSGKLPQCLSNMTNLSVLRLGSNNFHGSIPQISGNGSKLEMAYLGGNHLQGKVPRSLANCAMLRKLDLGENLIDDTFPFWLGELEFLQILIIRSNKFHGAISETTTSFPSSSFPNLRIIDLSHNEFSGPLSFCIWKGMKKSNTGHFTYLGTNQTFHFPYTNDKPSIYEDTMVLANKGIEMEYAKIPNVFAAIDFSSNNFSGEIPESIGNLNGLYMLNLSNNRLAAHIPSSLANLSDLESLDLSRNELSGEIPRQLAELNFLSFLNVSSNHLTGHVPRGKQLDTFQDNSFEGNAGLCGDLLITKRCVADSEEPTPSSPGLVEGGDEALLGGYDWIVITMAYASGVLVGFVIGNTLMARKPQWFVKIFGKGRRN